MRMHNLQFAPNRWPVNNGPSVVLREWKNFDKRYVFNTRDGPKFETGPPGGAGPPYGSGPPTGAGPPSGSGPPGGSGPPDNTGLLNGKSPPLNKKASVEIIQPWHRKDKTKTQISFEEIKKMKHLKLRRLLGLVLTGCLSIFYAHNASADAGDTISNTATLSFTVGGGAANILESGLVTDPGGGNSTIGVGLGNPTNFIEDLVVNMTVAEVGAATTYVVPGATLQVLTFTVTNNSNAPMDFLLAAIEDVGGSDPHSATLDTFDVVANTENVFVEDGTTPGYQLLEDTGIYIDELAEGGVETVYIVSTIPPVGLPLVTGQVAVLSLVVQAAEGGTASADTADPTDAGLGAAITNDDNNNISPAGAYCNGSLVAKCNIAAGTNNNAADDAAAMDTVFNDPAGVDLVDNNSAGVQDIARNGQASDSDSYTVGAAVVTVTKESVALWDPVNGNTNPKSIPGAYVRYTVTIDNDATASVSADLTTLSDTLQAAGVGFGAADLDPNLTDGTAAISAVPATQIANLLASATSGAGDAVSIDTTGTARPAAGVTYCTGDVGDADNDGCSYTGGAGGDLSIVFYDAVPANPNVAGLAVEVGYTEGELKPSESIVIIYNVIVQ